jgi:hypothetical protein
MSGFFECLFFSAQYEVCKRSQAGKKIACGATARFTHRFPLTDFQDILLSKLDQKYWSLGIFIDFAKAFDTVNHSILAFKLQCYGFRNKA